jgi:S-adenosylmethionine hydrolase
VKAVLLRALPDLRIVDMTHEIPSHQILEGAFLLRFGCAGFPPGTIHVAIVDPGVGGSRQPLAIACADGSTLLGPDNGLLAPFAEFLGEPRAYRLDREKVAQGNPVSATFEGRDLFARAAALVARGVPVAELGSPTDHIRLRFPAPGLGSGTLSVMALHVDHFGNVITNLPSAGFFRGFAAPGDTVALFTEGRSYRATVARTYEDIPVGALGILGSSFGFVEIAVNRGRAKDVLNLRTNARFEIRRL